MLLGEDEAAEARALGLALRLAYTLCGGALTLLDQVRLRRDAGGIALELPPTGNLFAGEAVRGASTRSAVRSRCRPARYGGGRPSGAAILKGTRLPASGHRGRQASPEPARQPGI